VKEQWVVNAVPEQVCDAIFHIIDSKWFENFGSDSDCDMSLWVTAITDAEAEQLSLARIVNQMPTREYHNSHCCK
jgi:hypothetical protein